MFKIFSVHVNGALYEVMIGGARNVTKVMKPNANGTTRELWSILGGKNPSKLVSSVIEKANKEYELL
jgi:hypothetical protein